MQDERTKRENSSEDPRSAKSMEPNMKSQLKRRLNQAIGECRSQASCTARRLVVQIRTMDTRRRAAAARRHSAAFGAAQRPRAHFSYSLAAAAAAAAEDSGPERRLERPPADEDQRADRHSNIVRISHRRIEEPRRPPDDEMNSEHQAADPDDFGWGSDFDEHSIDSSLNSSAGAADGPPPPPLAKISSGYLLEIGRPSGDARALADVIQDRGTCGHFKQIDSSFSQADAAPRPPPPPPSYPLHAAPEREVLEQAVELEDEDEDEGEEEAELRSLEARQGFRQIKDKLKVILDQRLATYEQSAAPAAPAPAEKRDGSRAVTIRVTKHSDEPTSDKSSPGAEFDCQSHCSDQSSVASHTDSNHSGSQDSGHSTQHSGYSCAGHLSDHHNRSATDSPTESAASPAACDQDERPPKLAPPDAARAPAATPRPRESAEDEERRTRFLRNRLIINSKLESLFSSRSGGESQSQVQSPAKVQRPLGAPPSDSPPTATGAQLDPQTRLKLLEQQRQISLKLKQKPRRKAARQALEPAADQRWPEDPSASVGLARQRSAASLHRASGATDWLPVGVGASAQRPQPAMSLRQLVKTVIDDCERPSKLSTLTRSLLNRSDSLSSELAADDDAACTSSASDAGQVPSREPAARRPQSQHEIAIREAIESPARVQQITIEPRRPMSYHLTYQPLASAGSSQRVHEQADALNASALDQTLSSIGTVDGLEYRPRFSTSSCELRASPGAAFSRQPDAAQPPPVGFHQFGGSCTMNTLQKSTISAYLKSLRFKLPKVKLMNGLGGAQQSASHSHQHQPHPQVKLTPTTYGDDKTGAGHNHTSDTCTTLSRPPAPRSSIIDRPSVWHSDDAYW